MTDDIGAPTRHPVAWQDAEFYDKQNLDAEMRRVFDICHGCRRCFNLCDSFPRLFDLVDEAEDMEIEGVASADFKSVVDACTLCDLCFMSMCPYTPPHEWQIDFPHLMLRYRAVEHRDGIKATSASPRLAETDANGRLARFLGPVMNWASDADNGLTRPVMEKVAGIHRDAVFRIAKICGQKPRPAGESRAARRQQQSSCPWSQGCTVCHVLFQLQQSGHWRSRPPGLGA